MKRRALFGLALLAPLGGGASWLALGGRARAAATTTDGLLRVGVLSGVEAEILRHVAESQPALGLSVEAFARAEDIRRALLAGKLAAGSFETGLDLADPSENPGGALVSAGATVTLPLGFYSKRLRSLSELGPGSRVVVARAPSAQGRALLVLYHYGLVGFDEALGPAVRLGDVQNSPRQVEVVAASEAALAAELARGSLVALEYASAQRLGLAPARDALAMEDGFSPFAQVLTVRRADLAAQPAWLTRLSSAYRSAAVKDFILRHFQDSVRRAW